MPGSNRVTRPQILLPGHATRTASHQALYHELIERLSNLHLEPGDVLTVTVRPEVYDSKDGYKMTEGFCQQLANLIRRETGREHQVLILRDGTEIAVKPAEPAMRIEQID